MKKIQKLLFSITIAFALLMIMPVMLPEYSNTTEVQAATLKKELTVFNGVSFTTVRPAGTAKQWSWTSSAPAVATVSYNSSRNENVISTKGYGTTTIKGTYGSYVIYYYITVPKISKTSIGLSKGNSYSLSITGSPASVTWKSSNKSVATVNSKGKVTAKGYGTTTITAATTITIGKQSLTKYFSCKVLVSKISNTNLGLYTGSSYSLSIAGSPTSVTWKSSDKSVATVSSKGKVTAKGAGTATITATAKFSVKTINSTTGEVTGTTLLTKTFNCKITVKNKTVQQNLTALKNTISKSSLVNSSGNHYIYTKTTNDTSTYKYTITYDKANDRLKFSFTRKDSASKRAASISFYVYNTSKTYKIAPVISITTQKGVKFTTKVSFDRRTYTKSTNLTFSITSSNISLTQERIDVMQSLSNSYLRIACNGWNKLVYNKTGMQLKNLGFTKYVAS